MNRLVRSKAFNGVLHSPFGLVSTNGAELLCVWGEGDKSGAFFGKLGAGVCCFPAWDSLVLALDWHGVRLDKSEALALLYAGARCAYVRIAGERLSVQAATVKSCAPCAAGVVRKGFYDLNTAAKVAAKSKCKTFTIGLCVGQGKTLFRLDGYKADQPVFTLWVNQSRQ